MVKKAISMKNPRAITALCWKAQFSMRFSVNVQRLICRIPHQDILYPKEGAEFPLTEDEMKWQLDLFESLST